MLPCTNLEQSRKLLRLGLNPAMTGWRLFIYHVGENIEVVPKFSFANGFFEAREGEVPSWGVAELISILSRIPLKLTITSSNGKFNVGIEELAEETSDNIFDALINLIENLVSKGRLKLV